MKSIVFQCILILLTLLLSAPLFAQNSYYEGGIEYKGNFWPVSKTLNYEEIEGSPYPTPKLVKGQVKFEGGDTASYFMRYDIYLDEMEFLKDERLYSITNTRMLAYLDIGGIRYIYQDYYINKKKFTGYMAELVKEAYSLYRKDRVQFESEKPPKSSYDLPSPAVFKSKPSLYLVSIDGRQIQQFKVDNSAYGKFPPFKASDIKAYMKQHNLKFKNEEDLIQLFQYLNSNQGDN